MSTAPEKAAVVARTPMSAVICGLRTGKAQWTLPQMVI